MVPCMLKQCLCKLLTTETSQKVMCVEIGFTAFCTSQASHTKSGRSQLRQSKSLTEHHSALWLPFCRRSRLQPQSLLPENAFMQDCCMDDVTLAIQNEQHGPASTGEFVPTLCCPMCMPV